MNGAGDTLKSAIAEYYGCSCFSRPNNNNEEEKAFGHFEDTDEKHGLAKFMLKQVENTTGKKTSGCPWKAIKDPFVSEIISATNFYEKFPHLFNDDISNALYDGIIYFKTMLANAKGYFDLKEHEEMKRKLKSNNASNKFGNRNT